FGVRKRRGVELDRRFELVVEHEERCHFGHGSLLCEDDALLRRTIDSATLSCRIQDVTAPRYAGAASISTRRAVHKKRTGADTQAQTWARRAARTRSGLSAGRSIDRSCPSFCSPSAPASSQQELG